MEYALAILVSLLPVALLLTAAWGLLFRRRHPGIFWTAFGFGIAATALALLLQLPLLGVVRRTMVTSGLPLATLLAGVALIEEAVKGGAWYACFGIFRRPVKRDIGIGAGCGAVAALAFAGVENLLFNLGATAQNGGQIVWDIAIARAGATVPLHATAGFLIGLIAWRIHGARRGTPGAWIALIGLPFLLHAAFNIIQSSGGSGQQQATHLNPDQWMWIGFAGLLVWAVAALAIRYYRRQRRLLRRRETAR